LKMIGLGKLGSGGDAKGPRVVVGPVIGKVTHSSAIILLEVSLVSEITCHLTEEGKLFSLTKTQVLPAHRPKVFVFEGLQPSTKYIVTFTGLKPSHSRKRTGSFKTFDEHEKKLNVAVLSCDRPERMRPGETNMWEVLYEKIQNNEIDLMLHLGDQVYANDEFVDGWAVLNSLPTPDGADSYPPKHIEHVRNKFRDVYRHTWNLYYTQKVLAHCPHLMILSDNDVFNDFTIINEPPKYIDIPPFVIKLAMQVYREYQRQLWDPDYESNDKPDEHHAHKIGSTGIMITDLRGSRMNINGEQLPNNPFMNQAQWDALHKLMNDPEITTLLVCSEIPFIGETPESVQRKIAEDRAHKPPRKTFKLLLDHWPYREKELIQLLDELFDWKSKARVPEQRQVVLLAGDIHVGVKTVLEDKKTKLKIHQLTATPITNHVTKFHPALHAEFGGRFSFAHQPYPFKRNFGLINIKTEKDVLRVFAELVLSPVYHLDVEHDLLT